MQRSFPRHPGRFSGLTCLSLVLCVLLQGIPLVEAAPVTIPGTEAVELPTSANGRSYVLHISLPASYASSPSRQYPVIYACDGYWDFPLLNAELGNLVYDQAMPECILVGIAYAGANPNVGALRQLDLTPPLSPPSLNSGHAPEFLQVIRTEFIPYVEQHYRVDTRFRVLTGSSYGGLFVFYTLFEAPELFQGYIAPSPSLWYGSNLPLSWEVAFRQKHDTLAARVYMTYSADESTWITGTTRQMARQLAVSKYKELSYAIRELAGERHAGGKAEAYNRGLRHVFATRAPLPSTARDPGYGSLPTLFNLSTRGKVGKGNEVLIAGLVVQGLSAKHLLIRAAGPALKPLGVADAIGDPKFRVIDAKQQVLASNDNWSEAPEAGLLRQAFYTCGAFDFQDGSKDAALLVTLEPGNYTVMVEGVDGAEGPALVEVYELLP